uniref:Uncharacterized protein n=1 Tax=Arundo donax TaxID=35708 RepID=A0A0A9EVT0_ARUDO
MTKPTHNPHFTTELIQSITIEILIQEFLHSYFSSIPISMVDFSI